MGIIKKLENVGASDVALVGGKNASLGELIQNLADQGVPVPGGFAVTVGAYRRFLEETPGLLADVRKHLDKVDKRDMHGLLEHSRAIRESILRSDLPEDIADEIYAAYRALGDDAYVAVRSSATAEDLPEASFAGQQDSFLYVQGRTELLRRVLGCYASLFTARAISYRLDMGFGQLDVGLSVGVQSMVRSDQASAGVMFTLDPDSGFKDVVLVSASLGLGESVVQGTVEPDMFYVHKPTLSRGHRPVVRSRVGSKEMMVVFDPSRHKTRTVSTSDAQRRTLCLNNDEVLQLARWGVAIEDYYSKLHDRWMPMDIEWAKDARSGRLYIVQARPETVHSRDAQPVIRTYRLKDTGRALIEGRAVGQAAASGRARVILTADRLAEFREGEILIASKTDPDWEPILEKAAAVVTDHGGRTSHAAIVARELGIPAVVGTGEGSHCIESGQEITVSCCEGETGRVYAGIKPIEREEIAIESVPNPKNTKVMMNLANPELAFKYAQLPNDGVGLARMEFILTSWVGVHPMALLGFDQLDEATQREIRRVTSSHDDLKEFFVDRLAQGVGMIAAAFWPKPVILRFSDFKTNEYANLLGGAAFEPPEENPMLGWRGASRYYHPAFQAGFLLELEAVKRVREVFGLTNLKVMVPFCRTPDEGRRVLALMKEAGIERGHNDLEVYVMAEIPANVLLVDQFADLFDGFSIGTNDLTQLVLGVDRDSDRIADLFDERNDAVRMACEMLIRGAHEKGRKIGICGQAPSDHPDFAEFLVRLGIDSLSLTPDAILSVRTRVAELERN